MLAVLLVAGLVGSEPRTRAQALSVKLTTVLADVASAVRQDDPSSAPSASPQAVDQTLLPKSAQDAIRAHGLRLDDSGAVQVYILLSDVSLDALQQLTKAGATVQIPDAPPWLPQSNGLSPVEPLFSYVPCFRIDRPLPSS